MIVNVLAVVLVLYDNQSMCLSLCLQNTKNKLMIPELPISVPFVLLKQLASAQWICGFKFKITDLGSYTA